MTMIRNTELELRPLDQNTETRELTAEELDHVKGGSGLGSTVGGIVGSIVAGPIGGVIGSEIGGRLV
jgi:hypothetical protein